MAAPALQNATALVQRQINGLPSTLKLFAECMKRLVDNASPGVCVPGHTKKTPADVSTKQKFQACRIIKHVLGYALEQSLDCVDRDTLEKKETIKPEMTKVN